jgi:hypothetical protein
MIINEAETASPDLLPPLPEADRNRDSRRPIPDHHEYRGRRI